MHSPWKHYNLPLADPGAWKGEAHGECEPKMVLGGTRCKASSGMQPAGGQGVRGSGAKPGPEAERIFILNGVVL